MRAKARLFPFAALTATSLIACNLVLGLGSLEERAVGLGDASARDGSPQDDGSPPEASTTDASRPDGAEAGIPACVVDGGVDPCGVTVDQTGASIYPTWPITSDLQISGQNVTMFQPLSPSYFDASPGAVTEGSSGLTWQTTLSLGGGNVSYDNAVKACSALGQGWRLPSRIEVATTQYRSFVPNADAGPTTCIPNVFMKGSTDLVWTSTSVPFAAGGDMNLHYEHYEAECGFPVAGNIFTAPAGVRCVKGTVKPATFVVSKSADTVYAVDTGLDWERQGIVVRRYADAKQHCDERGMRIPIIQELYGIIDTRTTALFDPRMFVAPAGVPRAILSQTIISFDRSAKIPYYEAIALVDGPWGVEDQAPPDDSQADILVRCVRRHP